MRRAHFLAATVLTLSACAGPAGPSASTPSVSPRLGTTPPTAQPTATSAHATPLPSGVLAMVRTGAGPGELAATADAIWVEMHDAGYLGRIDPTQNRETDRLTSVHTHCDVATGAGFVWATDAGIGTAAKVDPTSRQVVARIELQDACGIAANDEDLLVVSPGLGKVVRLDPETAEERASIPLGPNAIWVAVGPEAIWVSGEADGGTVYRVNPKTNKVVARIKTPNPFATGLAAGLGAVWVAARDRRVIYRIDPATNKVAATIELPTQIGGVTVGPDAVWASGWSNGAIYRIDDATNTITGSVPTGQRELGTPLFAFDSVWASSMEGNVVVRVDPAAAQ